MKRNIKLIVSCIAFIGLGIGIIGAGVNYFFNHSVLGMAALRTVMKQIKSAI